MSTSKYINKICVAVIILTLVLTILFMCGESLGISAAPKTAKYESTIFDTSYVHRIDIVMNDWDSFLETCENEEYATCTVVVDGQKHSNIAIRAKGNTSLSTVSTMGSQRYSFKLEFDHYEQAKMLDGLDKLCLNNLIQDNTMMKDYIVYQMMADFGVDAPLCSFAYLTVNGEDWGLYLAVEGIEDSFLSRNYGVEAGDLYKPDSMSFGGGRGNGMGFNFDDLDFDFGFGNAKDDAESEDVSQEAETENDVPANDDAQPGGFPSGGDMPTPPNGQMPVGFDPDTMFQGNFDPGSMSQEDFDPGSMFQGDFDPSSMFQEGFDPGNMSQEDMTESESSDNSMQPGGFTPGGDMPTPPDGQMPGNMGGGMPGGMGGMGSDDVKLQYIDDDPESYSNIFDNAKTEVSSSDKNRLIESLKKLSSYTDLEDVLDMDEVLRYFVIHNFVCNGDSYTGSMIHNYYLHESDGKLAMIPWDYNLAFGTFQGSDASGTVNTSIDSPTSGGDMDDRPMVGWIFSDEEYTEAYHELFSEFIDKWFTNGELETMIAETAEMLRPYVEKDPTKFCTTEEFDEGVEALSQFVSLRAEAVSKQLDGDTTPVDTGDLDLSAMGTMGEGMGGNPFGRGDRQGSFGKRNSTEEKTAPGQDSAAEDSSMEDEPGSDQSRDRPDNMPGTISGGKSMKSFLIMTGVSVLILLFGIIIAARKK